MLPTAQGLSSLREAEAGHSWSKDCFEIQDGEPGGLPAEPRSPLPKCGWPEDPSSHLQGPLCCITSPASPSSRLPGATVLVTTPGLGEHKHKCQMLSPRGDHRRPGGQAPFPPIHGVSSDPVSRGPEQLWGVSGARRLCADGSSLLGKVSDPGAPTSSQSHRSGSAQGQPSESRVLTKKG